MEFPFFTIGHSNRRIEEFIDMLTGAHAECVVDVRKMSASKANPQFNEGALRDELALHQISYIQNTALGGLRARTRNVPKEVNAYWTNQSFHNYADYALSAEFHTGLEQLLADGAVRRCAIMCSEAVWWRCHRRIIADYLIARGKTVFNIMGEGRFEPAKLSQGACIQPDGRIQYPALQELIAPSSSP